MPTHADDFSSPKKVENDRSGDLKTTLALTFGQKAVGFTFNPGGNPKVDSIKRKFAELIDELEGLRNPANAESHPEIKRMLSIAITECQSAQMWSVKAVTWQ